MTFTFWISAVLTLELKFGQWLDHREMLLAVRSVLSHHHSIRHVHLTTLAALLPTSQVTALHLANRSPQRYQEKLNVISKRLKGHMNTLRWPTLRHLEVDGVRYELPVKSECFGSASRFWTQPEADVVYLAGVFDGDGCVSSESRLTGCALSVGQSLSGQAILLAFCRAFGGTIGILNQGKGSARPALCWRVYGNAASLAAAALHSHCHVKQEQLGIAMTWPRTTCERIQSASKLKALKTTTQKAVSKHALSWEYITGFFDAEGCIKVMPSSKCVRLVFAQKDPAVLQAIQKFLNAHWPLCGAKIYSEPTCLDINRKEAVCNILRKMLSHGLLVKRAEAQHILASIESKSSHSQLRSTSGHRKGFQSRYRRLDADGCVRARNIHNLQRRLNAALTVRQEKVNVADLQSELAAAKSEHRFLTTQTQIQKLRTDIACLGRMRQVVVDTGCLDPLVDLPEME